MAADLTYAGIDFIPQEPCDSPDMTPAATTRELDLTGLKCPLPVLRTRKALKALTIGDRLIVRCTDPMAVIDVPAMVQQRGDEVESVSRSADSIVFVIVCGAGDAGAE